MHHARGSQLRLRGRGQRRGWKDDQPGGKQRALFASLQSQAGDSQLKELGPRTLNGGQARGSQEVVGASRRVESVKTARRAYEKEQTKCNRVIHCGVRYLAVPEAHDPPRPVGWVPGCWNDGAVYGTCNCLVECPWFCLSSTKPRDLVSPLASR